MEHISLGRHLVTSFHQYRALYGVVTVKIAAKHLFSCLIRTDIIPQKLTPLIAYSNAFAHVDSLARVWRSITMIMPIRDEINGEYSVNAFISV